jgi:hypothetical protein
VSPSFRSLRSTSKLQALARAGYLYALVDRLKSSGNVQFLKESSVIDMDEKQDLLGKNRRIRKSLSKYLAIEKQRGLRQLWGAKRGRTTF